MLGFIGVGLLTLGCQARVKSVTPTAIVATPTPIPMTVVLPTGTPRPTERVVPTMAAVPFTPTSQPTLSPRPITPTPTATPVSPVGTPTPTATLVLPTGTPTPELPTPTLTPGIPSCNVIPVRGFGQVWFQNPIVREYMGCPSYPSDERAMEGYVVQRFERGVMFRVQQSGFSWERGVVLVLFQDDMTFARILDQWREGEADPTSQAAPPGFYEPRGRFGKVWREGAGVKARLGWAIEPEKIGGPWFPDLVSALNGAAQSFEKGVMYWIPYKAGTPQYRDDRWIYVLTTIGPRYQWLAFPDTWQE